MLTLFTKQALVFFNPPQSHVCRNSPANPTQALSASLSGITHETIGCSRSQSKARLQTFLAPRHLATLQEVQEWLEDTTNPNSTCMPT